MQTLTTISELRHALDRHRCDGRTIGLVPTMGYLHAGHTSLVERAASNHDEVVTTVFVNPLQFAATEDLDSYPQDLSGDASQASRAGSTYLFVPPLEEMYPHGRDAAATSVAVADLASVMEGASRPTHFAGVCTVVAKLFNITGPCTAYFGEKDFQQLAIIRRMTKELSFPVEVVGCPIVREPDGLALSSRNVYLTAPERAAAPVLIRSLRAGAAAVRSGTVDADVVRGVMASVIKDEGTATLDYVEVVDPATLQPQRTAGTGSRLFAAIRFSRARLIDNLAVADAAASSGGGE